MYPTGVCSHKFYEFPKIHKKDTLLGPIVSRRDSVTYEMVMVIRVILVDRSQHHVHNTQHFVEQIKDIALGPGMCITSHDITALFTSVPVTTVLKVVQKS